ncbi:MAG: DUF456 domain-containing protein [Mycobacteriaceae bacterium]
MTANIVIGVIIFCGLVGIVLPIIPGVVLVFGGITAWAIMQGSATGWLVFAVCTGLLVISGIIKYTWPGQKMRAAGVAKTSVMVGALAGIVGFFVIPVIGLFIGFIAGVFAAEFYRQEDTAKAWTSTIHAAKAVGISILIELFGALVASAIWLVAAIAA